MNKYCRIICVATLTLLSFSASLTGAPCQAEEQPSFVIFLTDDKY
jgi:hypothetical protein